MKKSVFRLIVSGLFIAWQAIAQKDTISFLFVGNSYTFASMGTATPEVPTRLKEMAALNGIPIKFEAVLRGGKSLRFHWNNSNVAEKIKNGKYDYVVLQDYSLMTVKDDSLVDFKKYVAKYDSLIKTTKAKTILYMTWGRQNRPNMIDTVSREYLAMGKKTKAKVIPNGLAWKEINENQKDINLYTDDKSHPTPYGVYHNVAMFYYYLFGKKPE